MSTIRPTLAGHFSRTIGGKDNEIFSKEEQCISFNSSTLSVLLRSMKVKSIGAVTVLLLILGWEVMKSWTEESDDGHLRNGIELFKSELETTAIVLEG